MKYKNKETGAIIEISSILTSDYWEPVEDPAPVKPVKAPKKPKKVE